MRTLSETVRLDARTKLLNPKWYEGMLGSGYEGVREIQKRLTNTMGWSATSGTVDNWIYDDANSTFIEARAPHTVPAHRPPSARSQPAREAILYILCLVDHSAILKLSVPGELHPNTRRNLDDI